MGEGEAFMAGACTYPDDPDAMEKELAIATFCRCDAPHPKLVSVRCLRAKAHDGLHYCGGPSMGIEWEDEDVDDDQELPPVHEPG